MVISLADNEVTRFFIATVILLIAAHICGYIFTRLKLPKTVGEIFGGLLLGPTLFGYFYPDLFTRLFVNRGDLLAILYWLGLVLLMFCSGFEVNTSFSKKDKKSVLMITLLSTIIPFIFGWFITDWFNISSIIGVKENVLALRLIIATSIAITSIPVISKIFLDLGIMKTRFASIILGSATIHDIILWIFTAIAIGLVSSTKPTIVDLTVHTLVSLAFFAFALLLVPYILNFLRKHPIKIIPEHYESTFLILILMFFVVVAAYLKVNIVFGAFLAGTVIGLIRNKEFKKTREGIKEFAFVFFIPIYFAIVGIKIDLIHHFDPIFFLEFLILAMIIQGIAVTLAARLCSHSWLSSFNLATAMNARGGPAIVLATVALEAGIISESFFVTLILTAIVTSLIAGAWLRYCLANNIPLLDKE